MFEAVSEPNANPRFGSCPVDLQDPVSGDGGAIQIESKEERIFLAQ